MNNQDNRAKTECERKEDLMDYLYGEFSAEQEKSFKKHLLECISCQKEVNEFRAVSTSLKAWHVEGSPNISLSEIVGETVKKQLPTVATARSVREIISELVAALPAWFRYSSAFAAACSLLLVLMATLNTEVRYDKNGFSFQVALFSKDTAESPTQIDKKQVETLAREMITQMVAEKQEQIKQELEIQISALNKELSEKNSAQLSRVTLELKTEQRERLQRALLELERQKNKKPSEFEDDPFNLWGSLDIKTGDRNTTNN